MIVRFAMENVYSSDHWEKGSEYWEKGIVNRNLINVKKPLAEFLYKI